MIDPDTLLPAARSRLLALCGLYANAADEISRTHYLKGIEATALDIGYVFAVDLISLGWTPETSEMIALSKRIQAAA